MFVAALVYLKLLCIFVVVFTSTTAQSHAAVDSLD